MGVVSGVFQNPDGTPVNSGRYQWKLSSDAICVSTPSCNVPTLISGLLDSTGSMSAAFIFNDDLITNSGAVTNYQLTIKDLGGAQIWNEVYYLTGTAADLTLLPPAGSMSFASGSGGGAIFPAGLVLQTNEFPNVRQSLLDLSNGNHMSMTDQGDGTVIVSNVRLDANVASLNGTGAAGPSTLITASGADVACRVSVYFDSRGDGAGGTTATVTLGWTDEAGATTNNIINAQSMSAATHGWGSIIVLVKDATNLTYTITSAGAGHYDFYGMVEKLVN